jgi:hypothetical protein
MSTISASTTSTTAYKVTADTTGTLVLQTGSTPTTAVTIGTDQSVTFAKPPVATGAGSIATNTAYGTSALAANTTGSSNVAIGYQALISNTTAAGLTAVGAQALGGSNTGSYNNAFGTGVLSANTSGTENCGFGFWALLSNTTGIDNCAFGEETLRANTIGSYNTAYGGYALRFNTSGGYNTALGYGALFTNTTSGDNTAVGRNALYYATGAGNTAIGEGSGVSITSGTKNTILGRYSGNQGGFDIRTLSNYIVLSDGDGNPRGVCDNAGSWTLPGSALYVGTTGPIQSTRYSFYSGSGRVMGIEDASGGSGTQVIRFVSAGNNCGTISTTTTATSYNTSSDYRLKENIAPMTGALATVALLKPCTYTWKSNGSDGQGFIAHELAEVVPQCVTGEKDAVDEEGNPDYQAIDTSFLVATLTAAIQELKAEFDAYKEAHP